MAEKLKRRTVFNMLNGRCFYCGCDLDFDNFHMDHFVSKFSGGKVKDNLVPSCPECNLCKSNLDIEDFRNKLANTIWDSFQGKMIKKYYPIRKREIVFYFEEVGGYGDL